MLQECPFCRIKHPIIVRGIVKNPETQEGHVIHDRGYSFCNCKNVWYTDWSNIDLRVYDNQYREKYNINQTKELFDHCCNVHFPIFKEHNTNIKKFLDIGAIHDAVLDNALKMGWETIGLDINRFIESNKHRRFLGDVEAIDQMVTLEKVDVIWASHIIEHLQYPLKTIKNLYDKLNNFGLLYIAMPDPFFIDWKNVYSWGHWTLREHHIFWDMESFIKECEDIGFKCIFKNRNIISNFICVRDFQIILQKKQ